jgi:hypothetical protein
MSDIVFLLDESTSMLPKEKSYIKGINTLLKTQKTNNPEANFSMFKFSYQVKTVCIDSIMRTLPEFTSSYYTPNGITALYDAIGHVIDVKFNSENQVIVIILTDGEDNHSSKYNLQSISNKINYVKSKNWVFVYIAANQNAQIIGNQLGIETCLTYNETDKSIDDVANACSIAIGHAMYKHSGVSNQYCAKEMPTDVRDLMDCLENFTI